MTPAFMKTMANWRQQAREFAVAAIGRDAPASDEERRRKLRDLVKTIQVIDSAAIQLPFDVVPCAPLGRDLDLVRHQLVAAVAGLVAIELRVRPLRTADQSAIDHLLDATAAWVKADAELPEASLDAHVERGRTLADEMETARLGLQTTTDRNTQRGRALLSRRLAVFLNDCCDLVLALRAVETGRWLPAHRCRRTGGGSTTTRCLTSWS